MVVSTPVSPSSPSSSSSSLLLVTWSSLLLLLLTPRSGAGVSVSGAYTGRVLLVSMDGFRWDYLNTIRPLPNFERMARAGTQAPYINNTFVTLTFPTHYSIATGLYEESHGLVGNRMYDPKLDARFSPGNNEGRWWSDGEPIWITTTKQDRKTGCVFFPGTEVELQGLRPHFWLPYNITMPFKDRVDHIINWFAKEDISFGTLYFHEPDTSGHDYGPDSPEVANAVREMDHILGYLLDQMAAHSLEDKVNIIVTSDHGMANKNLTNVVEIPRYVDMSMVAQFVELECVCHIFPKEGYEEQIYKALDGKLDHMHVYYKENIPEFWHYKYHRRIPPILVIMDEDWSCAKNASEPWINKKGNHGYDNRLMTMKPIFLAQGPNIKPNHTVAPFSSVDIYPLMCELLGVTPAPNNGSMDNVRDILRMPSDVYTQGGAACSPHALTLLVVALSCLYHTLLPHISTLTSSSSSVSSLKQQTVSHTALRLH